MSITVEPDQLDAYAGQLERNSGYFIDPLRAYCTANCAHTEGMDGLLAAARPVVDLAHDTTTGLFTAGERNLFQVAVNLRAAADEYRARDEAAAEKVWLIGPRRHAPAGYTAHDDARHPGDYGDVFVPRPVAPAVPDTIRHTVERARHTLGEIEEWTQRWAHVSVAETLAEYLTGDWDTLRRNAAGYAALAAPDGVLAIRENLRHGMDSLSGSWDSPAATEFDFAIRARWVPALDAVRHCLELNQQALDLLARQAEQTYEACVMALEVLRNWVVVKCLRIVTLVATVVHGADIPAEIAELVEALTRFSTEIRGLFALLRATIETVLRAVRTAGAEVAVVDDLTAPGGGRIDPVTVG
jgi:hypothetical protein